MIYGLLSIILFLQSSLTTVPVLLVILLLLSIEKRDGSVLAIAFFVGLLYDLLTVQSLGVSSLFFVCFVFIILLYQKKYEIDTLYFVAFASFFGSLLYLVLFGLSSIFLQALVVMCLAVVVFVVGKHMNKRKNDTDARFFTVRKT